MRDEEWRPIPGFGGFYEASSIGRVRSISRIIYKVRSNGKPPIKTRIVGKVLAMRRRPTGHLMCSGGYGNERFSLFVHRAVLLAFHGEPEEGQEACHNNGIPDDNRISNLRWDTHQNNMLDKPNHENAQRGETHAFAKVTEQVAAQIITGTLSIEEASRNFGIAKQTARAIRRGATWAHVHKKIKDKNDRTCN